MAERIWVFDMPPDPLGLLICWLRNQPVAPAAIEKKMGMLTTERNRDRGSVSRTEKTTPIIKHATQTNHSNSSITDRTTKIYSDIIGWQHIIGK